MSTVDSTQAAPASSTARRSRKRHGSEVKDVTLTGADYNTAMMHLETAIGTLDLCRIILTERTPEQRALNAVSVLLNLVDRALSGDAEISTEADGEVRHE